MTAPTLGRRLGLTLRVQEIREGHTAMIYGYNDHIARCSGCGNNAALNKAGICERCGEAPRETAPTFTVKRIDLFGQVHDTYSTEGELNGWNKIQGRLL